LGTTPVRDKFIQSINQSYDSVTSFVAKYTVLWCCARHPHAAEIY
jgi:hypothetical protein